jgi:hypothetical protein
MNSLSKIDKGGSTLLTSRLKLRGELLRSNRQAVVVGFVLCR